MGGRKREIFQLDEVSFIGLCFHWLAEMLRKGKEQQMNHGFMVIAHWPI